MNKIKIKSFGPIDTADVTFGDLTILIGPQASGKSIFAQILKLIIDIRHIRKVFEQYSYSWGKKSDEVLDLYFGDGMSGLWGKNTVIEYNGENYTKSYLTQKVDQVLEAEEALFYIPAQRILCIPDGRAKYFTEFDESTPYVLRHFSETLRLLLQNGLSKQPNIFPQSGRLKEPLRSSINESIFHDGKVVIDDKSGHRKLKMSIDNMSLPYMTWSAGQKEFMPLLLGFYWLCPASKISKKNSINYVVIEEPEMGLHPQAIKSVLLQVMDLMHRGYKVIISTHSPMLAELAWTINLLKENQGTAKDLADIFDLKTLPTPLKNIFTAVLKEKDVNTYYFERNDSKVNVKNISNLDSGSEYIGEAEWGGLSSFISKSTDIIASLVAKNG